MIIMNLLVGLSFIAPIDTIIVGSYTQKGNAGIEILETGKGTRLQIISQPQASFQCLSKDTELLYSVSEEVDSKGAVYAYKKMPSGAFSLLNQTATGGDAPCHVSFREQSKTVYVANYMGGNISVFQTKDGALLPCAQQIDYHGTGPFPQQTSSHAHMAQVSPDEKHLFVANLGTDKLYIHTIAVDGLLDTSPIEIAFKPGTGPRHLVFNKRGDRVYVLGELKGNVNVFSVAGATLTLIQEVVLDMSPGDGPKSSADIHLSPNGKWLLASNRITSNSLAVYAVAENGKLSFKKEIPVAKLPRNFKFSTNGKSVYVASMGEDKIQVYAFDESTGTMEFHGKEIAIKSPVAVIIP